MDTIELTEWIDPLGMAEARRHLDCIDVLDRSPRATKRSAYLRSYLESVDRVYGPIMPFGPHMARPLTCVYSRVRLGRLYCCTHRGPQKYDEDFPRYVCAQGMPSILRHYLMRKWVRDFDIENCHVSLMYQLGSKMHLWDEHNGKMPALCLNMMRDLYEDRANFIEEVANAHGIAHDDGKWPGYRKDLIKGLLLRIMYGGSYDSWMEEHGIYGMKSRRIIRLQAELERLRDAILRSKRFSDLIHDETRAQQKKQNSGHRIQRSVFSKIAQHLECTVMLSMFDYLVANGFSVHSLIFDGLMVENSSTIGTPVLSAMEDHVLQHTGYHVTIVEKPLYNPSTDIDFVALYRWVTGREPSADDRERLLDEFMCGAEAAARNNSTQDACSALYMRGFSALGGANQN